jgi:hypothetical protein
MKNLIEILGIHNIMFLKRIFSRSKNNVGKIFSISIIICIILFVLYVFGSGISVYMENETNKSPLEKYYESHPDAYRKDMKEQEQIYDLKKDLQNKIDEQKIK